MIRRTINIENFNNVLNPGEGDSFVGQSQSEATPIFDDKVSVSDKINAYRDLNTSFYTDLLNNLLLDEESLTEALSSLKNNRKRNSVATQIESQFTTLLDSIISINTKNTMSMYVANDYMNSIFAIRSILSKKIDHMISSSDKLKTLNNIIIDNENADNPLNDVVINSSIFISNLLNVRKILYNIITNEDQPNEDKSSRFSSLIWNDLQIINKWLNLLINIFPDNEDDEDDNIIIINYDVNKRMKKITYKTSQNNKSVFLKNLNRYNPQYSYDINSNPENSNDASYDPKSNNDPVLNREKFNSDTSEIYSSMHPDVIKSLVERTADELDKLPEDNTLGFEFECIIDINEETSIAYYLLEFAILNNSLAERIENLTIIAKDIFNTDGHEQNTVSTWEPYNLVNVNFTESIGVYDLHLKDHMKILNNLGSDLNDKNKNNTELILEFITKAKLHVTQFNAHHTVHKEFIQKYKEIKIQPKNFIMERYTTSKLNSLKLDRLEKATSM